VITKGDVQTKTRYPRNTPTLERLRHNCELTFIYQKEPRGLGDALLQARDFVGDDSFVMMIPDQFICAAVPAVAQLLAHWRRGPFIWSSLLRLKKADRPFFIGARGVEYEESGSDKVAITRLRTEEETRSASRGLDYEVRSFGRTIFPPQIFEYFGPEFTNRETGEVDLLKTFARCTDKLKVFGIWLEGKPFYFGTFESYYHYLPRFEELISQSSGHGS
jgi:UTP--glucose-1-phosphate uridylyltransferase